MKERSKKTLRSIVSALMALVLAIGTAGTTGVALADETKTYSQTELFEEGYNLNIELEEEGAVLMQNKNNALPLSSDVTADLYGYFSYNIIHGGGSGKGKWDADCLQEKAAVELAGFDVNDDLWAWMGSKSGANLTQESWVADGGGVLVNANTYDLPEVPVEKYCESIQHCASLTASSLHSL